MRLEHSGKQADEHGFCLPFRGPLTGPKIKLGRSTEGPGGGAWLQVCGRSECVGTGVGWGSRVTYRHEASTTPWTLLRQRRGPGSGLRGRCGFGVKTWRAGPAAGWARRPPGSRGLATGRGLGGGAASSQSCHRCRSHWQVADPAGPAPRVQGLARCWGRFREVDRAGDRTWPLLMLVCLQPEPGGPSPTLALTLTPVSSSKTADQRRPKGAGRGPAVQFKIREWSPNAVKQTGGPLMF